MWRSEGVETPGEEGWEEEVFVREGFVGVEGDGSGRHGEECEGDGEMTGVLEWECVREMGCEKVPWEGEMEVGEVCV